MIQRIQSIWLFLAAIVLVIMLFLPIISKEVNNINATVRTSGLYIGNPEIKSESFTPLLITNIAVAVMCFINIFNFRKRAVQKRIAIFTIAAIAGFAFWCSNYAYKIPGGVEGANFEIGAYLPAVAILFIVLAIFGINKDERLIRSAERLR
ncbi:DUF4293 domain-containing protein [Pedobacter aquatilis]|uniref:DUF4293 domain-containing protein n=1 Tax=Pedobacter aquatilis TaxID=351343 RepID=UPI0025B31DC5|nr:DUF4293 domain-containing protein [Pedobacter aquatilis]MDN3586725.1 DUF4293 domain-containing protein [Pedobacter aquatilis]